LLFGLAKLARRLECSSKTHIALHTGIPDLPIGSLEQLDRTVILLLRDQLVGLLMLRDVLVRGDQRESYGNQQGSRERQDR